MTDEQRPAPVKISIVHGAANSHCFEDQILANEDVIAFADEPWTSTIAEALTRPQVQPETREGWMPIASAPRDGTRVDLWVVCPEGGRRWADSRWLEAGEHVARGTANWCDGDNLPLHAFMGRPEATHWMPLPTAPLQTEERNGA